MQSISGRAPFCSAFLLLVALSASACGTLAVPSDADKQAIRDEVLSMAARDQELEQLVIRGDASVREPGFFERKQAQQNAFGERCKELFDRFGYLGRDLVGERASDAFWLLVQHSDEDPEFQGRVAEAMRAVVLRGDAKAQHLAYLTDRVRANTGRLQVYGTQMRDAPGGAWPRPKPIEDPAEVDARRGAIGMEPLWKYVNGMIQLHFEMNAKLLRARGIDAPPLLPEGYRDW